MISPALLAAALLAAAPAPAPAKKAAPEKAAAKVTETECAALIDQMLRVISADEFEKDVEIKKLSKAERDTAWKMVLDQIPTAAGRPEMIKDCKEQFTRKQADCLAKAKVLADVDKCLPAP